MVLGKLPVPGRPTVWIGLIEAILMSTGLVGWCDGAG